MMIKANGEYLDFNGDIEIESQVKLFEDIESVNGDYSYDIEIQDNGHNRKVLGIPRADTVKTIYQAVPSEVIDDTGQSIYKGKLQVNRISNRIISATFYSGNTEWFALLDQPMSSLPLYKYDTDLDSNAVYASMFTNKGLVFPLIDAGALVTRSYTSVKIEDFVPMFYVKTLFAEIFNPLGIKLEGDFINDPIYNNLVVSSNGRSQEAIEDRSSYVEKTTAQNNLTTSLVKVTYQNDSIFPFFDGSLDNFQSSTYTADVKMTVKIDVALNIHYNTGVFTDSGARFYIYVNGIAVFGKGTGRLNNVAGTNGDITATKNLSVDAGDTIEVYASAQGNGITWGNTVAVVSGTLKVTPIFIYRVFGTSSVPKWTQLEFVSNILRLFNVLPSYNTQSKTLTLDLFNNIKNKEYVDISAEVVIDEIDFSSFVSSYGKNNIFKYQESEDEDLREYNISNFISYGSGNLTIDNDYTENSADIVESDFTSPITYLNGVFDMSMERINFVELIEEIEREITSVTESGVQTRFNISNADDYFTAGDLVRIDTELETYDGDWVVDAVTSSYVTVKGGGFDADTTGTIKFLRHQFTTDDNVYLFVNVPSIEVDQISSIEGITFDASTTIITGIGTAYFNMLSNGRPINKIYKQSLSFGDVNNPLSYQLTLLDTYWPLFSRILNSPVSLIASGYLKRTTFDKIKTFLRPVRIETDETTNLYYVNRNRGYKGSERPCELELIKLN